MKYNTQKAIYARLIELSADGQAWIANIMPFAQTDDDIKFQSYASPCKVPDCYQQGQLGYEPKIGYKGKLRAWTEAAQRREESRGITCE